MSGYRYRHRVTDTSHKHMPRCTVFIAYLFFSHSVSFSPFLWFLIHLSFLLLLLLSKESRRLSAWSREFKTNTQMWYATHDYTHSPLFNDDDNKINRTNCCDKIERKIKNRGKNNVHCSIFSTAHSSFHMLKFVLKDFQNLLGINLQI